MITATTFATIILGYMAVSLVWDLLDPDAIKVKATSAFRALVALAYVVTLVVLSLVVLL